MPVIVCELSAGKCQKRKAFDLPSMNVKSVSAEVEKVSQADCCGQ